MSQTSSGGGSQLELQKSLSEINGPQLDLKNSFSEAETRTKSQYSGAYPRVTGFDISMDEEILELLAEIDRGGSGIDINGLTHAYLYNNKFYNCTSNIAGSGGYVVDEDNSSLASSPFTNAGSGDFTVDTQVKAAGFPAYVGGSQITTTPTYIDVGAAQRQEPAGGGSTVIIARPKRLL